MEGQQKHGVGQDEEGADEESADLEEPEQLGNRLRAPDPRRLEPPLRGDGQQDEGGIRQHDSVDQPPGRADSVLEKDEKNGEQAGAGQHHRPGRRREAPEEIQRDGRDQEVLKSLTGDDEAEERAEPEVSLELVEADDGEPDGETQNGQKQHDLADTGPRHGRGTKTPGNSIMPQLLSTPTWRQDSDGALGGNPGPGVGLARIPGPPLAAILLATLHEEFFVDQGLANVAVEGASIPFRSIT